MLNLKNRYLKSQSYRSLFKERAQPHQLVISAVLSANAGFLPLYEKGWRIKEIIFHLNFCCCDSSLSLSLLFYLFPCSPSSISFPFFLHWTTPFFSCVSLTDFYLLFQSALCHPHSYARRDGSTSSNYFFTVICQASPEPVAGCTLAFPSPPPSARMEYSLQSVPSHPLSVRCHYFSTSTAANFLSFASLCSSLSLAFPPQSDSSSPYFSLYPLPSLFLFLHPGL